MKIQLIVMLAILFGPLSLLNAGEKEAASDSSRANLPSKIPVTPKRFGPLRLHSDEVPIARFLTREQLIAAPVFSEKGRPLGHVEDFVIDTHNGYIRYAAIGFPDAYMGEKLFAIPVRSMELDLMNDQLVWRVDVSRKQLATAPGFPRDLWPDIANRRWAEQVDIYFGLVIKAGDLATGFGTEQKPLKNVPRLARASNVVGIPVVSKNDVSCGTVERLVFDRVMGKLRFLTITTDVITNQDSANTLCIPLAATRLMPGDAGEVDEFHLLMPQARLEKIPRIKLDDALQSERTDWADDIDGFFKVRTSPRP